MLNYWFALLAVAAVSAFALMLSLRLLLVVRKLQQQVRNLQKVNVGQPGEAAPSASFSVSLGQAERKAVETKVQFNGGTQADKYGYVASLAEQGLDTASIATAMQMSVVEVEQLLRLARLRPQKKMASNEV